MNDNKDRTKSIHTVCVLVVICIFAISALALLNVGIRVYKNITVGNLETFELRTSLSFVATRIRQADEAGNIHIDTKDGNNILVLEEEINGEWYETDLYHYDGVLYEFYHGKGEDYEIPSGMDVMKIDSFSFYMDDNGRIRLTAINADGDMEELFMNVRSGGQK